MTPPPPHEPDERHENRGREDRKEGIPLFRKGPMSYVAAAIIAVTSAGTIGSHSVLGSKADEQRDALQKVQVTLAEIKGKIDASESTGARVEKGVDALAARVSSLEQAHATIAAQIAALREKK